MSKHCSGFNGLYTPFGSPVIGGQKRCSIGSPSKKSALRKAALPGRRKSGILTRKTRKTTEKSSKNGKNRSNLNLSNWRKQRENARKTPRKSGKKPRFGTNTPPRTSLSVRRNASQMFVIVWLSAHWFSRRSSCCYSATVLQFQNDSHGNPKK